MSNFLAALSASWVPAVFTGVVTSWVNSCYADSVLSGRPMRFLRATASRLTVGASAAALLVPLFFGSLPEGKKTEGSPVLDLGLGAGGASALMSAYVATQVTNMTLIRRLPQGVGLLLTFGTAISVALLTYLPLIASEIPSER
jgi:hypothetical protein